MKDIPQETRWVLRAQAGDRAVLDELLRAVQEPLYRYVLSLMGEPALAEDVIQEVFLRIYRKLRWLRTPELFRPWAYRIASRETFKHLRRERRWTDQVRDEAVLENRPAPADLAPGDVARLPEMVAAVSPASRAVIVLHYLHEMKLDEVAEVLGIGLGTVKSRLAYGLATLRRLLNEPDIATRRSSS